MTQQPQQIDLGGFMRSIERVSRRVDEKPRLSWATVVQSNPLRIHVDGHPGPLLDSPRNAASQVLLPGQRVQVALQDLRYTIVSDARVNDLRGTSAQRVALGLSGVMQEGMRFFDTDENRDYVWRNGGWVGAWTTVNPIAPFRLYGSTTPIEFSSDGQTVHCRGAVSVDTSNYVTGTTDRIFASIPAEYRPSRFEVFVCQGSGSERWQLAASTNGDLSAARYSGTHGANVWLPFSVSWRR